MRGLVVSFLLAVLINPRANVDPPSGSDPVADPPPATASPPESPADSSSLSILHQAWLQEHDPAKRQARAAGLINFLIYNQDAQHLSLADEVTRDGAPQNELKATDSAQVVKLNPLTLLTGVHDDPGAYPVSPIFRRITAQRFEAWTSTEGWLFNDQGKLLVHVKVPRRDGTGRQWFGAFLANGSWITTDLWADDRQLNQFTPGAKWQWVLHGTRIVSQLPKLPADDSMTGEIRPSIGWARADKTGNRWLVCLGVDWSRGYALIGKNGSIQPLADTIDLWKQVYPRAMSVRGSYNDLYTTSDDGEITLHRNEASHGMEVGWPRYVFSDDLPDRIIREGNDSFGFWPHSRHTYIGSTNDDRSSHLWFFDPAGKYEGESDASFLGDAADGKSLLLLNPAGQVLKVTAGKAGLAIKDVRAFQWPDGSPAIPVAVYDDLGMGFFLRGPGLTDSGDAGRQARQTAEIVMAQWPVSR